MRCTQHALERWRERVDARGDPRDVERSARRATAIPEWLLPYTSLGYVDRSTLLWDRAAKAILVVRAEHVVTVIRPARGLCVLLERQLNNPSQEPA